MPNWCENNIEITFKEPLTDEQLSLLSDHDLLSKKILEQFIGSNPSLRGSGLINIQRQAFGTKWFPFDDDTFDDVNKGDTVISFYASSAWTPCNELLIHLVQIIPVEQIRNSYSEPGCGFAGRFSLALDDELDDSGNPQYYFNDEELDILESEPNGEDGSTILTIGEEDKELASELFGSDELIELKFKKPKKQLIPSM